ncbi:MAG: pyridoxamine 5'-phosphate oxidase family protein [Cyclobacteriaceae bacterium]
MVITENTTLEELKRTIIQRLKLAVKEHGHPFKNCSLATAGDHELDLRYVVLREVTDKLHLFIYTDARTQKVKDININHEVAALFYDPQEKLQIRILGHAKVHYQNELAEEAWEKIDVKNRRDYLSAKRPGEVVDTPDQAHEWLSASVGDYFAIIEIVPQKMDVLQLSKSGHSRAQYHYQSDEWSGSWIAP